MPELRALDLAFDHENADDFAAITQAMREADEEHQVVGGGTRHYIRECFVPALEKRGLVIARKV